MTAILLGCLASNPAPCLHKSLCEIPFKARDRNSPYCKRRILLDSVLVGQKTTEKEFPSLWIKRVDEVISTTISEMVAPSANKMDHLQLIQIQTSRVPAEANTVPVVRQCCCCKKKKKPAASGDGGGGYDKGSGGIREVDLGWSAWGNGSAGGLVWLHLQGQREKKKWNKNNNSLGMIQRGEHRRKIAL